MYLDPDQGLRKIYSAYRSRCHRKKINFELTTEEFAILITSQCFYCGVGPERLFLGGLRGGKAQMMADAFACGTIDRYDPELGYSVSNSRSACWNCNRAKGTLSHYAFLDWARRLVDNNSE